MTQPNHITNGTACPDSSLVACRLCDRGEWCQDCDRGLCDGCREPERDTAAEYQQGYKQGQADMLRLILDDLRTARNWRKASGGRGKTEAINTLNRAIRGLIDTFGPGRLSNKNGEDRV